MLGGLFQPTKSKGLEHYRFKSDGIERIKGQSCLFLIVDTYKKIAPMPGVSKKGRLILSQPFS